MFMSFLTAPMDSVTLPSVKDGTSSHILCKTMMHKSLCAARKCVALTSWTGQHVSNHRYVDIIQGSRENKPSCLVRA